MGIECSLDRILSLGSDHLIIGRVVRFHVKDELFGENGRVDVASLNSLRRLAGNYAKVETVFELPADEL